MMRLEDFSDEVREPIPDNRIAELEAALIAAKAETADLKEALARLSREAQAIEKAEARFSDVVDALEGRAADAEERLRQLTEQIAADAREAFAALLPTLADAGFLDEAALSAERLMRRVRLDTVAIRVAAGVLDEFANRLSPLVTSTCCTVTGDADLPDGAVEIHWGDGGAHIDRDALIAEATAALAHSLAQARPESHGDGRRDADE